MVIFSFLLLQFSSPEVWLRGCGIFTQPWSPPTCLLAFGCLFPQLPKQQHLGLGWATLPTPCVSSFFVWWCLQINKYFCSWTMTDLRRNTCRYISVLIWGGIFFFFLYFLFFWFLFCSACEILWPWYNLTWIISYLESSSKAVLIPASTVVVFWELHVGKHLYVSHYTAVTNAYKQFFSLHL